MPDFIKNIRLKVNGKWRELKVHADDTLVKVLREDLGLTGAKTNCEQGECGACTVLLDGDAVPSCLILAVSINGHEVITIEGLSKEGKLDMLQEAFIEKDAVQCGYCTPGMIMSAKALLLKNSDPSIREIKKGLEGNYCRCTGYKNIIEAVKLASKRYQENQGK